VNETGAGIDLKAGRPGINPADRHETMAVRVPPAGLSATFGHRGLKTR